MFEQISSPIRPQASTPSFDAASAGLAKRMNQVTRLLATADTDLSEKVTHDLRVAIRRCRSVAYGAKAFDPEGPWRRMSKELRRVFRVLGYLRDLHVMGMWIEKLGKASDPVKRKVVAILQRRELTHLETIHKTFGHFDRDSWENWSETLPNRLEVALGSHPNLTNVALVGLRDYLAIHQKILAEGFDETWHGARVALKRFRYTLENFLPDRYHMWHGDLEELQDVLGEIHDLDVLSSYLISLNPLFEPKDRERWQRMIQKERHHRIEGYLARTKGPNSPLIAWHQNLEEFGVERADESTPAALQAV
jgi:CHAD domain-containing protein